MVGLGGAARYSDAELPRFVIMIDDDTWVNVSSMREIVQNLNPEVRYNFRSAIASSLELLSIFRSILGVPKTLRRHTETHCLPS